MFIKTKEKNEIKPHGRLWFFFHGGIQDIWRFVRRIPGYRKVDKYFGYDPEVYIVAVDNYEKLLCELTGTLSKPTYDYNVVLDEIRERCDLWCSKDWKNGAVVAEERYDVVEIRAEYESKYPQDFFELDVFDEHLRKMLTVQIADQLRERWLIRYEFNKGRDRKTCEASLWVVKKDE